MMKIRQPVVTMARREASVHDVCGCDSCAEEEFALNDCTNSQRKCGHHCNHAWTHDKCCWCGQEFGCDTSIPDDGTTTTTSATTTTTTTTSATPDDASVATIVFIMPWEHAIAFNRYGAKLEGGDFTLADDVTVYNCTGKYGG